MSFTRIAVGSGNWSDANSWQTNFLQCVDTNTAVVTCSLTNFVTTVVSNMPFTDCAPGGFGVPDGGAVNNDDTWLTNAGVYTLTINVTTLPGSNFFSNAAFTEAIVTLNIPSPNVFFPQAQMTIGDNRNSTTTVYVASYVGGFSLNSVGALTIGRNGFGKMILTNGLITGTVNVSLGTGGGGRGTLVVSGPTARLTVSQVVVGSGSNNLGGSSMVITNGGFVSTSSTSRIGSSNGSGGSSNNVIEIFSGGIWQNDGGPLTIGRRSQTTNDVSLNNMVIVHSGALLRNGNTTARTIVIGNAGGDFAQSASAPGNTNGVATNNFLIVETGGMVTSLSTCVITPTNGLYLMGALISGAGTIASCTISNYGGYIDAYGTIRGGIIITNAGSLTVHNMLGGLKLTNSFVLASDCSMLMELGTVSSFSPVSVALALAQGQVETNRFQLSGTLNFTNTGGFATGTYTLFTYGTNALGTNVFLSATIGAKPNPAFTYTIVTNIPVNSLGHIDLVVTDTNAASLPFQITSIVRQGANVVLTWNTSGASNIVQVSTGTASGSYSNNYADLSPNIVITTPTTNYTDVGGATSGNTRYYRVRKP